MSPRRCAAAVLGLLLSACGSAPCSDAPLSPGEPCMNPGRQLTGTWELSASQTTTRCRAEMFGGPLVIAFDASGGLVGSVGDMKLGGLSRSAGTIELWNESLRINGTHVTVSRGVEELRGAVEALGETSGCEPRWQFVGRRK